MTIMRVAFRNPELLKIVKIKDEYVLNYGGEPVETRGGNIISHKSLDLIQRIKEGVRPRIDDAEGGTVIYTFLKSECDAQRGEGDVSSGSSGTCFYFDGLTYQMYLMQQDGEGGPLEDDWEGSISSDRMLYMDESLRQERPVQLITNWLHECKCELPNLWPKLGEKSAEKIEREIEGGGRLWTAIEYGEANGETIPKPGTQFVVTLKNIYLTLQPEERAFVTTCYFETGDVIYPIALALRKAKFSEYSFVCPGVECDLLEQYEYLQYAGLGDSKDKIISEIKEGETLTREFKSTLRWNLRSERNDDEMKYACLKTIAAFLNTNGGCLFLGVSDKGEIIGTETDGFPNNDKYQLHLFDLIKECLEKPTASLVDTEMVELEGKHICLVKCEKSPKPVYLKFKNKDEAYFIRTGPGTTKLSTSEAHTYISNKFID
jgi:hypothetical protein